MQLLCLRRVAFIFTKRASDCSRHLWPLDRRIHLDPAPLIGFCVLWIVESIWILHPPQGSGVPGCLDPSGSRTLHTDLYPLDTGTVAPGSSDLSGSCTPHRDLWPLDRWIRRDPAPITGIRGVWIVDPCWIRSEQGAILPYFLSLVTFSQTDGSYR